MLFSNLAVRECAALEIRCGEMNEPPFFLLISIGSSSHYSSALCSTHYYRCCHRKGSGLQVSLARTPAEHQLIASVTSTMPCSSSTSTSGLPTAKAKSTSSDTLQHPPPSPARRQSPTKTWKPPASPTPQYYPPQTTSSMKAATNKLHTTPSPAHLK